MSTAAVPVPASHRPRPPLLEGPRRAFARRMGVSEASRRAALDQMLAKPPDDVWAYWLQLMTSMGMATLGLVLGSPGVVIGAMLVAPLMTPIVEMTLSLLVGASLLLLRSVARVFASVVAVAGSAALITMALPYHAATSEIMARTGPTLLDLGVATCCAIAAAFTTARPFSSAASTAAGTAIGISLVPPLCVVGYGIGTREPAIAEGALLLFTANLAAIVAFSGLYFWLVGFSPMPPEATDEHALEQGFLGWLARPVANAVDAGLSSRWHLLFRLGPPLALLAGIVVPLDRALEQVAWQVRTQQAIAGIVQRSPLLRDAVTTASVVEAGHVEFRAVVVGTDEEAQVLETRLATQLAAASGVVPLVAIRVVPPGAEVAALQRRATARAVDVPFADAAHEVAARLRSAVAARWPERTVGPIVARQVQLTPSGALALRLVHWGEPIGETAEHMLAAGLATDLGMNVEVVTIALPPQPQVAPLSEGTAWWERAAPLLDRASETPGVSACITAPEEDLVRRSPELRVVRAALARRLEATGPDRVRLEPSREWSLRLIAGRCGVAGDLTP